MKKIIGLLSLVLFLPLIINVILYVILDEYKQLANTLFSIYSVFFAMLIASTYSFDTTNYSEHFEKKLDGKLAHVRRRAMQFYIFTVACFVMIDILEVYQFVPIIQMKTIVISNFIIYILKSFSSIGFSCIYTILLVISEMNLFSLRNDIKHQYRKERMRT